MIGIGLNIGNRVMGGGGGGFDVDAQAFFDRVTTAGGTLTTTEKNATNQLVLDMKSAGIWSAMKAVYPMVGASVNLLSYTEDFSNAFWLKPNSTITTNSTISPDGTLTADTISYSSVGYVGYSTTISGDYTISVYFKYKGSQWVCVENYNASTDKAAWFDLQNGVVGTTAGGATSTITSVGNGWYRCSVTTNASSGTDSVFAFFTTSTNGGFTRNNDLYAWGAQLEIGSTATTYAPVLGNRTTEAAAACAQNLKSSSFTGSFTSGWTFASTGVTPNGTSAYMNTSLTPSASLTQDSTHLSFYSRTNISSNQQEIGSQATNPDRFNLEISYNGNLSSDQYNYLTGRVNVANSDSRGFYIGSRTNSSTHKAFKNNAQIGATNTTASGTLSLITNPIWIGVSNGSTNYSTKQCAFASIGDGLTDTQASNFYTAVQAFQTTLSRQV